MATVFEHIDESGQDTAGIFFVVSILITGTERDEIGHLLELIEKQSGKCILKWRKSSVAKRQIYIRQLIASKGFVSKLFFEIFPDSKEYLALTATAAAHALRKHGAKKAIIYVDGLLKPQVPAFQRQLKSSIGRIRVKVRGVRKDENNPFIRLVDALCGLVRDAQEGSEWSKVAVTKLKRKGILTEL